MNAYKKASSKANAQSISQKEGVKYSELTRLPYFDMVQNVLIDPMHNLLMGLVSDIAYYEQQQIAVRPRKGDISK